MSTLSGIIITGTTSCNTLTIGTTCTISSGWYNFSWIRTETINVLGKDVEFSNGLNDNQRVTIAMLNFNGYKFWKHLKNSNYSFGPEIDEQIDKIVIVLDRQDKLNSIE
jgi:hypothetical protein